MHINENVEITVLCMIYNNDEILLQNRTKKDWCGITFPGGHVERNESFTNAVIREMKEETGLDIYEPHLCGIEQFAKKMLDIWFCFLKQINFLVSLLHRTKEKCYGLKELN